MKTTEPSVRSIEMSGIASVLVFLDGDGGKRTSVRLAADAARRQQSSLHAVYLETWPSGLATDQRPAADVCRGPARRVETRGADA